MRWKVTSETDCTALRRIMDVPCDTQNKKKWLKMMMMFASIIPACENPSCRTAITSNIKFDLYSFDAGTYKYWTAGSESISCGVRRNYLTSIRFRMTGLPYAFTTQWMKPRASGR